MISEFHQLAEKIEQLAQLTYLLRHENAGLRLHVKTLSSENADLSRRMDEAQQRVATLLKKFSLPETEKKSGGARMIQLDVNIMGQSYKLACREGRTDSIETGCGLPG